MDDTVCSAWIKGQTFEVTDDKGLYYAKVKSVNKRDRTAVMEASSRGAVIGTGRRRRFRPQRWLVRLDEVAVTGDGTWSYADEAYEISRISRPDPVVEFELVKKDLAYDGKLYRVLRDGTEIGWIESYVTTNVHKIAGSRLVRHGGKITQWKVARTREDLLHGRTVGYLSDTRREAVGKLVRAVDK